MLLGVAGFFSNREIAMTLLAIFIMLISKIVPTKKIYFLSLIQKRVHNTQKVVRIYTMCMSNVLYSVLLNGWAALLNI